MQKYCLDPISILKDLYKMIALDTPKSGKDPEMGKRGPDAKNQRTRR
jgi:hypothetical protein